MTLNIASIVSLFQHDQNAGTTKFIKPDHLSLSLTFLEGEVMVWFDELGLENLMATKKVLLLKLVGHAACERNMKRNILRVNILVVKTTRTLFEVW